VGENYELLGRKTVYFGDKPDVSEKHIASIFRVEISGKFPVSLTLQL
jgi:hypothetical protein